VRAHVRHAETEYDKLLARGVERCEARDSVAEAVEVVVRRWSCSRTDCPTPARS
jgi:hypothetical protein